MHAKGQSAHFKTNRKIDCKDNFIIVAGKVFKREFILESVWGKDVVVGDRTIDVHIRKLREKIGDSCFKTVKGVGYKFQN